MIRKLAAPLFVGAVVMGLAGGTAAHAQQAGYPDVRGLKAFSQPANYMSIPGFLRYDYVLMGGRWMSRQEAVMIASQQRNDIRPMSAAPAKKKAVKKRVKRRSRSRR